MDNVRPWLINWFKQNRAVAEDEILKNLNSNYFEQSWIDSFELIDLVISIEKEFKISFSNDEFQDRSFVTIDGLTAIITKKITDE